MALHATERSGVKLVYLTVNGDEKLCALGVPDGEWAILEFIQPRVQLGQGTNKALLRLFKSQEYVSHNVKPLLRLAFFKALGGIPAEYTAYKNTNITLVRVAVLALVLNRCFASKCLQNKLARRGQGSQRNRSSRHRNTGVRDVRMPRFEFTSIEQFNSLPEAPALDVLVCSCRLSRTWLCNHADVTWCLLLAGLGFVAGN